MRDKIGRDGGDPFESVDMAGDPHTSASTGGLDFDGGGFDRDPGLILEALGQGVCVCESDGHILWGNRLFRALSEGMQRRVAVVCRRVASSPDESLSQGESVRPRRRTSRISSQETGQHFEVIVAPLIPEEPHPGKLSGPMRFVAVISDITYQESLRRKIVAINRAGRELIHLDAETIAGANAAERLALLEKKVIAAAHELLSFDHFVIRRLDPRTNRLEVVMSSGLTARACNIELFAQPEGNGISGFVASTGKAFICSDTETDPRYVFGLDKAGSSLTVPLRLFDSVIGVFNIESSRRRAFTDNDRHLAEIFGHYIAMALHILNLLVVERYTTRAAASGFVQVEVAEPLNDLIVEVQALRDEVGNTDGANRIERITSAIETIRARMKRAASGPATMLLGVEDALERSLINPRLEGKRVLVVDNDETTRTTIRDVLSRRGAVVTQCGDGPSALKLLLQWELTHDADLGYDMVLSDINLGDHTGYEVFAGAKAAQLTIPVILMTGFGYDPHHTIVKASQEGLQCVLYKPFHIEKLVEAVLCALAPPPPPPPSSSPSPTTQPNSPETTPPDQH